MCLLLLVVSSPLVVLKYVLFVFVVGFEFGVDFTTGHMVLFFQAPKKHSKDNFSVRSFWPKHTWRPKPLTFVPGGAWGERGRGGGGGGCGREDYVQCAAARLQEQNGSLLHMDSFGAIPRVERNVLACPTLKEPASL